MSRPPAIEFYINPFGPHSNRRGFEVEIDRIELQKDPLIHDEIMDAITDFLREKGREPLYIILSPQAYERFCGEMQGVTWDRRGPWYPVSPIFPTEFRGLTILVNPLISFYHKKQVMVCADAKDTYFSWLQENKRKKKEKIAR